MGVTGKKYADFFVLTFKGWHKERIYFDPKFWSDVLKTLAWFWYKYVGPELITHELKNHLEKEVLSEKDTDVAPSSVTIIIIYFTHYVFLYINTFKSL